MTSIRDMLGESLGIGERFHIEPRELDIDRSEGYLVASHPYDASPMDIAVVEGCDRLATPPEKQLPGEPITIEIVGKIVDGMVAGRVVDAE
ncbi:hypothetical protein [Halostagnicola sp. A-GB9-2]|uniref:hypothetical protein n=1 Tax=Halostagnicola sp. A-GB9-2 TaxID=3048066 RepID=UPI0024BFD23D|nr:hypothetical protein [Halostagnicola sp. A-GB9-2]MDJ1431747.1 hypothetical protein [Halostagnicola sp. A-GB9-2]